MSLQGSPSLLRKLERERKAREEAERLLESKSLEIFHINEKLQAINIDLDRRVRERTRELITANREIEAAARALEVSNERYRMVLEASGAAIWEWKPAEDSFYFSPNLQQLLDYPEHSLRAALRELALVHPDDRQGVSRAIRLHLRSRRPLDVECRMRLSDGRYCWFHVVGNAEWDEGRRVPARLTGSITNIDDRMRKEAIIERLAKHDVLTDIPNRARFGEKLEDAILEADAEGTHFALLLLDINDFKLINDTLGYRVGDQVLQQVADQLQHLIKGYDIVARIGGDEFGVILKRMRKGADVASVAARVLQDLHDSRDGPLAEARLAVSIGIACYPGDGSNSQALFVHGDMALQQAKRRSRRSGSYVFFDAEQDLEPRHRRRLEHELDDALEQGQFSVEYQPEVMLANRSVVGAEALLRWNHPERGRLLPAEFIAAAESSSLIVAIGDWVIDRVCADLQQWMQLSDKARIAINLSPVQLAQGDVVNSIARALRRYHCPAWCLEVEVTENVLLHDLELARKVLSELHELGVLVSLDDFGSGYSSLAYLQQLPIDKVKIDRVFIHRLLHDQGSKVITETIIRLAHTLNMQVLAEGVEQAEQFAMLSELGCDFAQGFFIAKPQDFKHFIAAMEIPERNQPLRLRPRLRKA